MTERTESFKVAIVGGGMGGLALAVGLTRGRVKVDIFEQAPKFGEIGAGVSIGPNARHALKHLGVLEEVLQRTDEPLGQPPFLFISGLPGHEEILQYPGDASDFTIAAYRASFLDTLIDLIPQDIAHFNKKCAAVTLLPSHETLLSFEDGTTHTADLVVGCDGIKSVVRSAINGSPSDLKYSGSVAYRGLIPIHDAVVAVDERIRHQPAMFLGLNRHIVVFPIKEKDLLNVVVFSTDRKNPISEQAPAPGEPWVVPATQAEMLSHYQGWGPKVLNMLSNIKQTNKWFLHSLNPPLESYVRGPIALLGDAAHSMLPHLGAGAGQAIEDALLLSQLLVHPLTNASNIELVLQAYNHVRSPRANRVLLSSYAAGEIYELNGPSGESMEGIRKDLNGIWGPVWHHDLEEDFREAEKFLKDRNVFPSAP